MGAYWGEIAALMAALSWAVGSLLVHPVRAPAAAINLFKNVVGTFLSFLTLAAIALIGGGPLFSGHPRALGYLFLSSVVGIVIGDTCYFRSLQILGARRALVIATVAPTFAVPLGWWILGEDLTPLVFLGIAVTLLGVVTAVREGAAGPERPVACPGSTWSGIFHGFLGALCQALGAIWSKQGVEEMDALEANFVRLAVAAGIGCLIALVGRRIGSWKRQLFLPGLPSRLFVASSCGSFFGIWMSLLAFKHTTHVAVATTLTSMSPIMIIPLVWIFWRRPVHYRAILGAFLAVGGVTLLFLGRS